MSGAGYDEICAGHRWEVPARYNIAADVCDKHPRDKPAMVWESFDGSTRELDWGELQDLANQAAHTLAARGVDAGRPGRGRPAADARGRCDLLRSLEARRDPALDVRALRRRWDRASALGLGRQAARHRRRQRAALRPTVGAGLARARARHAGSRPDGLRLRRHRGRRPCAALLHVRDDGAREGDRPRAPLHPRPRGVPLLPRGTGRRALPRDGRVGLGRGDRAAARPLAARRGAVRLPARGRLRPAQAARLPEPARGDERVHDADGDALDDGGRGCGDALPAGVPPRVLGGRAAESGGDPLVSRAVRRDGARLLRAHGVVSTRRELPVSRGARGLDGQADAGLGRAAPRRGRAARRAGGARRDLPARPLEPALSARLLAQRRSERGDLRR